MRDVMFGLGGMVVGGSVGVVGLLACEALAGLAVAAWLFTAPAAPEAPIPVARTAAAPAAEARATAAPGEVQLHSMAAVRVMLDGEPMTYRPDVGAYSGQVAPGEHRLQILEAFGTAVKAETTVRVRSGVRSQLRYAKGVLADQGTMPLAASRAAPAPVEAPPAAEPAPMPVAVASVSVTETASGLELASVGGGGAAVSVGSDGVRIQSVLSGVKLPRLGRN